MKGGNGGGGSSFAYVVAICLFAVLFGCQAWPAQCRRSSHQPPIKQQASRHTTTTMGLYLNASDQANGGGGGGYQTKIQCPAAVGGDDQNGTTKKLTLIFCTVRCYCHGSHTECYCCQLGRDPPVCYNQLSDCQANCPICNPKCPPAPDYSSFA